MITPKFYRQTDGGYNFYDNKIKNWTKESCEFMIDFVLDSSLTLQEFDFSYSELEID